MGPTEVLSGSASAAAAQGPSACPRCGEPGAATPRVATRVLGLFQIRRCLRCGTRAGTAGAREEFVFSCESCGLPFTSPKILAHADQQCEDCRSGQLPAELPDDALATAAENEIRRALAS